MYVITIKRIQKKNPPQIFTHKIHNPPILYKNLTLQKFDSDFQNFSFNFPLIFSIQINKNIPKTVENPQTSKILSQFQNNFKIQKLTK